MTQAFFKRLMKQRAVYWPLGDLDSYAQEGYGEPIAITCRWENRSVLFMPADGAEEMSSQAVIYTDVELDMGGALYLGELSEVVSSSGADDGPENFNAFRIRAIETIHDLPARKKFYRVFLGRPGQKGG